MPAANGGGSRTKAARSSYWRESDEGGWEQAR